MANFIKALDHYGYEEEGGKFVLYAYDKEGNKARMETFNSLQEVMAMLARLG